MYNISIMLVISSFNTNEIIINKEAIDDSIYGGYSHQEYCERIGFDYELFKKIYNNDLTITLEQLISFSKAYRIALREFVILC